jgi:hypothetical protein
MYAGGRKAPRRRSPSSALRNDGLEGPLRRERAHVDLVQDHLSEGKAAPVAGRPGEHARVHDLRRAVDPLGLGPGHRVRPLALPIQDIDVAGSRAQALQHDFTPTVQGSRHGHGLARHWVDNPERHLPAAGRPDPKPDALAPQARRARAGGRLRGPLSTLHSDPPFLQTGGCRTYCFRSAI